MNSKIIRVLSIAIFAGAIAWLFFSSNNSQSKAEIPGPVTAWYEALKTNDEAGISAVMSDNAMIELKDLGIVQTRDEFIASFDEWAHANKGADILTRAVPSDNGEIIIDACYKFPSNEVYNREAFVLEGEKISKSVQENIAQTCPDF